jgi:hypothetical protein
MIIIIIFFKFINYFINNINYNKNKNIFNNNNNICNYKTKTGPKSIGSKRLIQQNWILTQDPRLIGAVSRAHKRIIIKIIIFIPQIIIFFILIL